MVDFSAKERKKYATVKVGGKSKFPIKSAESARNALKLEGHAKPPLNSSQKASIARRAASFGVHSKKEKKEHGL